MASLLFVDEPASEGISARFDDAIGSSRRSTRSEEQQCIHSKDRQYFHQFTLNNSSKWLVRETGNEMANE
jgi:hypothetical protein